MNVYLDTIGCRLNQSEIEAFAAQFRAAGHTIVSSAEEADTVVVNTCAVTAEAASDSRQKIRQAARAGAEQIIVTGCWSAIDPVAAGALPSVTRVVPNPGKDTLVSDLLGIPVEEFDLEPVARQPLPGAHARTRAFLKVQDGCDNHCTFCITRIARGAGRSRSIAEVQQEVRRALDGGTQEVVLTGVHLGSWGQDFNQPAHLYDLIAALLKIEVLPRLRLSSLEPWDLTAGFFDLWSDARLCRHLHLPLQSGCEATLRRMARKTTPDSFARLAADARRAAPGIAITTDVIVGFPGETEANFVESMDFVRRMEFAQGHVFTYSPRPQTAAARMPNQVPLATRKRRNAEMRAVFADTMQAFRASFAGASLPVLWESTDGYGPQGWQLRGLTDNYLPVMAQSQTRLWNQISLVRLTAVQEDGLRGEILSG